MTFPARVLDWFKTGVTLTALAYAWLMIEYGDNCTRYRAPWCDFLDASVAWVPQ